MSRQRVYEPLPNGTRFLVALRWNTMRERNPTDLIYVECRITGNTVQYGNLRYQVEPIQGEGSVWFGSKHSRNMKLLCAPRRGCGKLKSTTGLECG